MNRSPKRISVIGAGTMGSGIAAHLANLGHEVTLFDLTQDSVEEAFERAKRAKPPHFWVPTIAQRIKLASITENLDLLRESDWVCEAIVEKLELKRDLFAEIEPLLKSDAIISTNTSGLQIALLSEGRSDSFRRRFLGTHFFNPPRYLKLLELIPTESTDKSEVKRVTEFLEFEAGRRVVVAKDTPGFIANRFGMWAMIHAVHTAEKLGLSIEQVDAITGPFLGRPRSASFRLNDLVGLDIMADIAANLYERCQADPYRENLKLPKSMTTLIDLGWIGEKAGQGYYRREGKELLALDLGTHAYRQRQDAQFASLNAIAKKPLGERVAEALTFRDEAGEFLREHLTKVLQYANYLKEEVSHSVLDFDRVMEWGFAWEMGPFAMIDAIGAQKVGVEERKFYLPGEQFDFSGGYMLIPIEPQFRTIKDFALVEERDGFNVRNLGDGAYAISTTTKMGVVTPTFVDSLTNFLKDFNEPFVYCSESKSFSVGFDLKFLLEQIQTDNWTAVDEALRALQDLAEVMTTKRAVAAVHGYVLGGGFELAIACPIVVAHPEANIGFPESKVGLIPGGSGTARMRLRNQTSVKQLADVAMHLTLGTVSTCAEEARGLGYLRPHDVVATQPDSLIEIAKIELLEATPYSEPEWTAVEGPLTGIIDRNQEERRATGDLTEYDETIGDHIKYVFGKTHSWTEALEAEREAFEELMHHALTQARIKHMIENGKPLRN